MILITHYLDLESYPPVLNHCEFLDRRKVSFKIISGRSGITLGIVRYTVFLAESLFYWFRNRKILRLHLDFEGYITPLWFFINLTGVSQSTKRRIHFHEYWEKLNYSPKWLSTVLLFTQSSWSSSAYITHTNYRRALAFEKDWSVNDIGVLPNYPYFVHSGRLKEPGQVIKFVYIGYSFTREDHDLVNLRSFLDRLEEPYVLDIFTRVKPEDEVLIELSANFCGSLSYWMLRDVLINYDVGLVLYNQDKPNWVWNVPNKFYEYWNSNLYILYSQNLALISEKYSQEDGVFELSRTTELFQVSGKRRLGYDLEELLTGYYKFIVD